MHPAWADILDTVSALQRHMFEAGEGAWFRGHGSAKWELKASLHRFLEDTFRKAGQTIAAGEMRELLCSEFKALYHTFRHDAWPLLDPIDRGHWSIIFHMQHHGVPTLLLDWSESFACALFFAFNDWRPPDDAAIFVFDPAALNSRTVGLNSQITLDDTATGELRVNTNVWHPHYMTAERELPCIAVTPIRSNRRMLAQRAAFTLSGTSFDALDIQYDGIIRKIILPAVVYGDAERFLELVNVGHHGYFPDLEGLQRKYRARYDWHMREAERLRRDNGAG